MDKVTIIQISGIILAGLGGALATFTETRDNDLTHLGKKYLNRNGWLAILLTGTGIILGVSGQAIANKEAKSDTNSILEKLVKQGDLLVKQGELASQSLENIERVTTRFDDIVITSYFDLPTTNLVAMQLKSFIDRCLSDNSIVRAEDKANFEANRPISLTQYVKKQHFEWSLNLLTRQFPVNDFDLSSTKLFLNSLTNVCLRMAFRKNPVTKEEGGTPHFDLEAEERSVTADNISINYDVNSGSIHLRISADLPRASWASNGKILGVHDIDREYCYFKLIPGTKDYAIQRLMYPDCQDVYVQMELKAIEMKFDSYSLTIERFRRMHNISEFGGLNVFFGHLEEFQLPSEKKIMSSHIDDQSFWF